MRVALNEINFESAILYFKIQRQQKGWILIVEKKLTGELVLDMESSKLALIFIILESSFNIKTKDITEKISSDTDKLMELLGECLK